MATSTSVCSVCYLRQQTATSTHWCIECEDPLCSDCREHHNVLKPTRNHKTIPISDYQLLPSVVTDIKQHCVFHNEIYQLFCVKHDSPICNKCVKDHGKCGNILSLDEIVKDIKTSESFVDLEQSLDDLFDNINRIRIDRESDMENIIDQKRKISAQVCHIKTQVIQHVKQLEEEFIKELDQIEFDCCDSIRSIVSELQDKAKKINQMKLEVKNTKKYASDMQTFLRMRDIQTKTTKYEKHLQSSIENKNHEKITLESTIDTKIQNILNVGRFGLINIKRSTIFVIQRSKDRQAEIMVPQPIKLINEINLEFEQKIDTACEFPFGCCGTKKGKILFIESMESTPKLLAVNAKGGIEYNIRLTNPYHAFDVAYLDDKKIAVSTGHLIRKRGISIVDIRKRKVVKFIDLPGFPFGITYDGKSLICCVQDKDLHVISCTDYSFTTISNTVSSRFAYVSTHAEKILFTNPETNKVTCCLYSGAQLWEFKDKSVLDGPTGITVDNKGNVFVVGSSSRNVVLISPDGKQFKQLLTEVGSLQAPTAILFNKVRKQLLVTNISRFAYIYNISFI